MDPVTTDTFTAANGRHYIAGELVSARVWERFEELSNALEAAQEHIIDAFRCCACHELASYVKWLDGRALPVTRTAEPVNCGPGGSD